MEKYQLILADPPWTQSRGGKNAIYPPSRHEINGKDIKQELEEIKANLTKEV